MNARLLFLTIALAAPASALDATQLQNEVSDFMRQHIDEQLANAASAPRVELNVGPLESGLSLADCEEPLAFEVRNSNTRWGRNQVKVSCSLPQPWSVYVPVMVKAFQPVVVARAPIPRGAVIGEADLEMAEKELNALGRNYFDDPGQVVGKTARRNIPAGSSFGAGAVEAAVVIGRGDSVRISSGGSGLTVSMEGKALTDGRVGERIRVQNLSSGRTLQATVVGPGEVRVSR